MKKKLILILGLILILTGCGDNQDYIKNKVLDEFKENNIYSYFNAEGLKMIQDAGFSKYEQVIAINGTRIILTLNFAKEEHQLLVIGQQIANIVRGKDVVGCSIDKDVASCNVKVSIDGNYVIIPSIGNEEKDEYFNQYPVLINNMFLDDDYLKSLSNPNTSTTQNNPLGGSENAFKSYYVYYENLENNDRNLQYFSSMDMERISTLLISYTNYNDKGESFSVGYAPPKNDYDYTMPRSAVTIILGKGERYE